MTNIKGSFFQYDSSSSCCCCQSAFQHWLNSHFKCIIFVSVKLCSWVMKIHIFIYFLNMNEECWYTYILYTYIYVGFFKTNIMYNIIMRIDNQFFFPFQVRIFLHHPIYKNSLTDNITYFPPYLLLNVKKPCVKYDHFCVWILISRKSCQKVSFSYGNMHQLTAHFSSLPYVA